ncbi:MAG: type II toxin-antitoxin system VapC family toxin [Candidatus Tectomicrobia bacterium]|uniref:Type II toxin-antitoxin system VapC family toxin n=1 Tax=Tectimicrobiota bacterium TaxID=2528274 RepID=A0A932CQG4_UNCTE|nr:type II toxin-antitoxin system VapC family toxin [Candidatus Tectomicrobia bacterium]
MREDDEQIYFFDTSALVKRYHREVGTDVVDAAFDNKDAFKMVSDFSVIEFYSAFAKKVRTGEITEDDFRKTIQEIAEDIRSGAIQLVFFGDYEKKEAAALIEKHGLSKNLRTLDAMQLAVMKSLGLQSITHIYCADRTFTALIEEEGFSVINPEEPPVAGDK